MEKITILPELRFQKEPKAEVKLPKLTPAQRQAIISDHHRQGGLKGGATMKKRGRAYFEEIGRKGALARWQKNNPQE